MATLGPKDRWWYSTITIDSSRSLLGPVQLTPPKWTPEPYPTAPREVSDAAAVLAVRIAALTPDPGRLDGPQAEGFIAGFLACQKIVFDLLSQELQGD